MLARRRSDLAVAALLTVWAALPLLLLAWAWRHGDVLTGSDGALPGGDQLYYLSLARESGAHVLFGDRFDLGPVARVGFNPVHLASGLAARLGLDPRAALWLWKPVAALVLAGGFAAYVRGFRLGRAGTAAALALALAYFSPLLPVLDWTGVLDPFQRFLALLVSGELMPAWQLWGYTHAALALGAMAGAAVFAERALSAPDRAARRRAVAATAGLGALVALLHPWQGATLALMLAGAAAWEAGAPSPASAPAGERLRSVLAVLGPLAAIAAVLVYLLVLSQTDPHWEADGRQSEAPQFGVGYLLLGFGPLAALAALGVPRHPDGPRERLLLLWPVAAFAVYLAVSNSRFHAFQGMSLPLAILAVRGWRRLRLPRMAGVLAVAAVTLPGLAYEIDTLRRSVALDRNPYYLRPAEARALAHLQDRRVPGGVLAPASIGMAVPARTGRSTWVGHFAWTPDYAARHDQAEALFSGRMPAGATVALVRATGARFLLSDCGARPDLTSALRPLRPTVRRFGCATVYELPAPAR